MDKKRIMVVEDEGVVALDIRQSLEDLGFEVPEIAVSGEEAVAKAIEHPPDLILMDIRLGAGMDGIEAALRIGERLDIPVIYLTAYTDEPTLDRAKLTGQFGYMVKPFAERELRINIEMALYKHDVERRLREHEQWLSTTLKSIGDGVIATQSDGRVLFINPVAQRLTAWPEQEALNHEAGEVFHIEGSGPGEPEGSGPGEPLLNPFQSVMATGQSMELTHPTEVRSRDGRRFPVEDSAAPILGPKGEVNGVVLVFRDVSHKRDSQNVLRQSEDRLVQAQKMESLGRLAGGIAHDFNNLLAAINGYSELVLSSISETDPMRPHVEEIRKSGERAAFLTQRILAYSRKEVLDPKALDMNAAVDGMAGLLRRLLGSNLELETSLDPKLYPVKADPGQLEQVIMNLVLNARDAMPEGGRIAVRTWRLECLSECIGLDSDPDFRGAQGKFTVLEVTDQGTGMDEATKAHIFEPFFTTKEIGRGTGLGLSMVFGFVKQSGGSVTVSSQPGKGSRFRVYLPAAL